MGGVLIGIVFWLISKYSNETIGYGDSWIISLMGIYLGGICMLDIFSYRICFSYGNRI